VTNKRLIEQGVAITDILGSRFVLTVLAAGVLALHEGVALGRESIAYLPHITVLAMTFVVLPAFTLQLGLQRAEAATVTIILFSIPLIAASLELLDPNTQFDPVTLIGVLIGFGAAVYGATARVAATGSAAPAKAALARKEAG
jgi:drug/metabolite transporter (DMT)-like permease